MSRRRASYSQNNSFSKGLKDYIVPIVWGILIIFLVYFCFKKDTTVVPSKENQVWINITKEADSSATIFYLNQTKKELEDNAKLYKTERILVSSWRVKVNNEDVSFNLNKLWELTYLENGDFSVSSGEVWIDTKNSVNVDMKFAKLKISKDSHLSVSQNEVNSSINVVSWTVEVLNLKWKNTVLSANESLDVWRAEASDEKIDLSLKKWKLSDIFLTWTWFTLNNWKDYLVSNKTEENSTWWTESSTWETEKAKISTDSWKSKYLNFSNLLDESNVSESQIIVSWAYDTEVISKIELNWLVAKLNSETWTFRIEWVNVWQKVNDLVFKVFDKDEELKEKFVYTLYNDSWSEVISWNTVNNSTDTSDSSNVFSADGTKFVFTAPSTSWTYTTTEDFVTIKWSVSAQNIDRVTVNGAQLKSFNWKTWRYHAAFQFGTLKNWTNQYEVRYFSNWELVYKNIFTIVKKDNSKKAAVSNNAEVNLESNSSEPIAY